MHRWKVEWWLLGGGEEGAWRGQWGAAQESGFVRWVGGGRGKKRVLVPAPWLDGCVTLVEVVISSVRMRKGVITADRLALRLTHMWKHFWNCRALNGLFCKWKHISKVAGTLVKQFPRAAHIRLFCPCLGWAFLKGTLSSSLLRSPLCAQSWKNDLNPKYGCWQLVRTRGHIQSPSIDCQGNY